MAKHEGRDSFQAKSLRVDPFGEATGSKAKWTGKVRNPFAGRDARVETLEQLCGEAYQMLGMLGAPVQVLDKFAAAANGDRIPEGELLPLGETDFDEVRQRQETIDQISTLLARNLASRGGRRSTEAKREAARANGQKGGRPRKQTAAR